MIKKQDFNQIERLFTKLLQLLSDIFTESEQKEVQEFIEVGEYGVALETLCFIISEENQVITNEIYSSISQLGEFMEMDTETWESVKSRIRITTLSKKDGTNKPKKR